MKNTKENKANVEKVTSVTCMEKDVNEIEEMMVSAIKLSVKNDLEGEDKENWKLVEKLFNKAAKLKRAHIFGRLYNRMVVLLTQFYNTKIRKFAPVVLTNEQVNEIKKLLKEFDITIADVMISFPTNDVTRMMRKEQEYPVEK